MAQLEITNVIDISVATAQTGVNAYNTSNLGLFTDEAPQTAIQTLTFSDVSASGSFVLNFDSVATSSINWNDTITQIQSKINAVTGMSNVIVTGTIASKTLTLTQLGVYGSIPLATVSSNSLETSGSVAITVIPKNTSTGWSGGSLGYAFYLSPNDVATDFGTSSKTYQMALAVFSQQPNILLGGGQLIVIPMTTATQTLTLSGVPSSGNFTVTYAGKTSAAINWDDDIGTIQTKLQAVSGLGQVVVNGSLSGESLVIYMFGVYGASPSLFTIGSNTLQTSGTVAITVTPTISTQGESIASAINRTSTLVQYFGIMANETLAVLGQTDLLSAAAVVQSLTKIAFFVSYLQADIESGGMIDQLRTGNLTQSRGLYYGDSTNSGLNALLMMAAYAGRGLSTNFSGSNTTSTMHLKPLSTIQPDPTMTQTILNLAIAAGADTYISLQGVSCIFCTGANGYFDNVYNLEWIVGALQVAGFNFLAQASTKIPQTESGMDALKGAYRAVCQQAVTNQYLAPGTWNSPVTFGNQNDLINNIGQVGYYIWSVPIAQQSQTDRTARKAPLVQIAIKAAGAIQSSTVVINVNA